jgi:GntR family transcriptional regulator
MIEFRLDTRSGVPTYLQLVQQVEHAIRLGILRPGDQLPTAKEVVARLAINPNTVLRAYRDLDRDGLVETQRGRGTFVADSRPAAAPAVLDDLARELADWLERARKAGLDDSAIAALWAAAARTRSAA